jgi:hypothetical protein
MNSMPDFTDILRPIRERISYRNGMANKLASIIADLLNANEPLLKAEADGDIITVIERGGGLVFAVTIDGPSLSQGEAE